MALNSDNRMVRPLGDFQVVRRFLGGPTRITYLGGPSLVISTTMSLSSHCSDSRTPQVPTTWRRRDRHKQRRRETRREECHAVEGSSTDSYLRADEKQLQSPWRPWTSEAIDDVGDGAKVLLAARSRLLSARGGSLSDLKQMRHDVDTARSLKRVLDDTSESSTRRALTRDDRPCSPKPQVRRDELLRAHSSELWSKKARALGSAFAVAIAVMAVVTLDVTSSGLEQSAAAIISFGKADFTVAQRVHRHVGEHHRCRRVGAHPPDTRGG